jgi:hypothetical protein
MPEIGKFRGRHDWAFSSTNPSNRGGDLNQVLGYPRELKEQILNLDGNNVSRDKVSISNKAIFLICNSCFWCASYLRSNPQLTINRCPSCRGIFLEYMPIASNEHFSFDWNSTTGITLNFSRF